MKQSKILTLLFIFSFISFNAFALDLSAFKTDKVNLSGTIEVEAAFSNNDMDDEDTSDISLATAELGVEAAIVDWATGFVLFEWDDDEDKVNLDEAHITLGGTETIPYYMKAGRLYVPFGVFETNMISDPLTLELGEIRDEALQVGFNISGFYASAYAFNGAVDEDGEDDEIRCFGASAGYGFENDSMSLDVGIDWVNSIAEGGGFADLAEEEELALEDYPAGYAVHANFTYESINLFAEYVAASDDIEFLKLKMIPYKWEEPSAYAVELGYTFEIAAKETTIAAGIQGTEECAGFLPETRYIAALRVNWVEGLSTALEYSYDEDYDTNDGGTDEDATNVTLQLALEF